jgi:hypothetical protein
VLSYNDKPTDETDTIASLGVKHHETLTATFEQKRSTEDRRNMALAARVITPQRPILTNRAYTVTPDITAMSIEELKAVSGFSMSNQYGSVEWLEPVDLTNVNLDKVVMIEKCSVEIYPIGKCLFDPKGTKLNHRALLTIHSIA